MHRFNKGDYVIFNEDLMQFVTYATTRYGHMDMSICSVEGRCNGYFELHAAATSELRPATMEELVADKLEN